VGVSEASAERESAREIPSAAFARGISASSICTDELSNAELPAEILSAAFARESMSLSRYAGVSEAKPWANSKAKNRSSWNNWLILNLCCSLWKLGKQISMATPGYSLVLFLSGSASVHANEANFLSVRGVNL